MIVERLGEVVKDRLHRARMSEAGYWDERVRARAGHARSVWHAQAFSDAWNRRQLELLTGVLSSGQDLSGLSVLDVGCGTGRIARALAERGADAVGVDFSEAAVHAARHEAGKGALRFEVGDVVHPPLPFEDGSFDAVVSVGCLAVACTSLEALGRAFSEMARLARPGGRVLVLEPIHTSRLLGRVLKAPAGAWVAEAQEAGLVLEGRHGMGFVPFRLALSSLELPGWLVHPAFDAGERLLGHLGQSRLADYALLGFRRP